MEAPTQIPGTKIVNGELVRVIMHGNRESYRPVALTLDEARKSGADFYVYGRGWILGGRKPAYENPLQSYEGGPALAGRPATPTHPVNAGESGASS